MLIPETENIQLHIKALFDAVGEREGVGIGSRFDVIAEACLFDHLEHFTQHLFFAHQGMVFLSPTSGYPKAAMFWDSNSKMC